MHAGKSGGDLADMVAKLTDVRRALARLRLALADCWMVLAVVWRNRVSQAPVCSPGGPVVSLTTHGRRLSRVHLTIESIARGRMRPSRLYLWLGDARQLDDLPAGLRRLQARGLDIRVTLDVGPHTKYWPTLSVVLEGGGPLVTADDDILYPSGWLEGLAAAHAQRPTHVHAYRAHRLNLDEQGILPYAQWAPCQGTQASVLHFATGVSGVIYPPEFLRALRQEGTAFLAACPKADDVWLHAMAVRHGVAVCQVGDHPRHFPMLPGTEGSALMAANVSQGGNDVQIQATYGRAEVSALRAARPTAEDRDGDDVFTTSAWFELLAGCGTPAGKSVRWQSLSDIAGRSCGVLPLMSTRPGHWTSLSNYYSPVYAPAWAVAGRRARVQWSACVRVLRTEMHAATLQLSPMPRHAAWWAGLREALEDAGYSADVYTCFGNWYLPLADRTSFDDYWAQRPSRLRRTVERARKKLDASHRWQVDVVCQEGDELEAGIAAYQRVYAGSWKEPEPYPDFMPNLMRLAARQGVLRLGLLSVDGEVRAAQVWLMSAGKAQIYKLAYLPGHERLSLGSVLTAALMRQAIEVDCVTEVDYLMGDDGYKRDWMSHRRERVGLVAFQRRSPDAWIPWGRHMLGRWRRSLGAWWSRSQSVSAPASAV